MKKPITQVVPQIKPDFVPRKYGEISIPEPTLRTSTQGGVIGGLLSQARLEDEYKETGWFPQDTKWLLGYRIPPFQRPVVWNEDQMIRFIASIWRGGSIGTYLVNDMEGDGTDRTTDLWLIDGQQRLTALSRYFNNEFSVLGATWEQVDMKSSMRFRGTHFGKETCKTTDEMILREEYDNRNYGGVAHTEEQRALPKPKKAVSPSP